MFSSWKTFCQLKMISFWLEILVFLPGKLVGSPKTPLAPPSPSPHEKIPNFNVNWNPLKFEIKIPAIKVEDQLENFISSENLESCTSECSLGGLEKIPAENQLRFSRNSIEIRKNISGVTFSQPKQP